MTNYNKSPFQWAGGKGKALSTLLPILEKYRGNNTTLVEPFIGAANVSLNMDFDNFIWNDLNQDLINSYDKIFSDPDKYIRECGEYFEQGFDMYNELRDNFNKSFKDSWERACLFQYLNKHGFNGLCRYNKQGKFNVPRGTVTKRPKAVPVESVLKLSKLKNRVSLTSDSFNKVFEDVERLDNCLVYCDPPYVPLTSDFKYTMEGFDYNQQIQLRNLAKNSRHTTIISNHWTPLTEDLYKDATKLIIFDVQRTISCKGDDRKRVQEVIAIYEK